MTLPADPGANYVPLIIVSLSFSNLNVLRSKKLNEFKEVICEQKDGKFYGEHRAAAFTSMSNKLR